MKTYLFTLTITPVQSFISQARKTKDLFVGSAILSGLMRETIKKIENYQEVEIIFPKKNRDFVSNKFVAKLKNKTEDELKEIGESLEKKINKDFLMMIFESTCKYNSSLENFFKVYWVAVELTDESSETYIETYKKLEQNLGAIKNLRDCKQEYQVEGKAKCVLCGERNFEEISDEDKLCLVCLTKRCDLMNNSHKNYLTISDIVMLDRPEKLDGQDAHTYLKNNSSEKKYYALLQFDIDDMGKKLSSLNMEQQKELSTQLGEFAKEAENIVNKSGQTIYAGGDDFLGFVNLKYLFTAIKCIKRAFRRCVITEFPDMTFSTSIIIAHYKAPLHKVLDFSRELLDESKAHFDDKNGVGVIVLSDSAVNAKTICRYEEFSLLEELKDKKIGMSLHYKLNTVFSYLDEMCFDDYLMQKQMIKVEIKRLLKREEGSFNGELYSHLIAFLDKQKIELSTNNYRIDFDNFIAYLKTLEQLRKVL